MNTYRIIVKTNAYQAQRSRLNFEKGKTTKVVETNLTLQEAKDKLYQIALNVVNDDAIYYDNIIDFLSAYLEDNDIDQNEIDLEMVAEDNGWKGAGIYQDGVYQIFQIGDETFEDDGYYWIIEQE